MVQDKVLSGSREQNQGLKSFKEKYSSKQSHATKMLAIGLSLEQLSFLFREHQGSTYAPTRGILSPQLILTVMLSIRNHDHSHSSDDKENQGEWWSLTVKSLLRIRAETEIHISIPTELLSHHSNRGWKMSCFHVTEEILIGNQEVNEISIASKPNPTVPTSQNLVFQLSRGLPQWFSDSDSTLPIQGAWVQSLGRELAPTCHN